MKDMKGWLTLFPVVLLAGCARQPAEPARVDLASCLEALTNEAAFAERPLGRMRLISTFDRTGGNQDWGDLDSTRDAQGRVLIADLKGPGCLKRIWKTNTPEDTEWLIYIDGETSPRIHMDNHGLFGQQAPFLPPLCDKVSGGEYCFLPIPYADSAKVALKIPRGTTANLSFYHINYESYPEGTQVTSFPSELSAEVQGAVEKVREVWRKKNLTTDYTDSTDGGNAFLECGGLTPLSDAEGVIQKRRQAAALQNSHAPREIAPSSFWTWLDEKGPAVLSRFRVSLSFPPGTTALQRSRALRALVLRITWDGKREPSVLCPLGDFFCNGLWRRRFESLPLSVDAEGFECRFPMPFRKSARAEIVNDGDVPVAVTVSYEVLPEEVFLAMKHSAWPSATINESLAETQRTQRVSATSAPLREIYFHASWNSAQSPRAPLQVLKAKGRGHYVGCYLISLGMDGTWNNLEGDETIAVDGEGLPSWHGTGLEDYFNGAWYYYGLFDLPLHGLLEKASMRTAQYRFHASDAVAFDKEIAVAFEFGAGNASQGYMSSVAYWYQDKPRPAGSAIPPVDQRFPPMDKVGVATIMPGLFELERIGRLDEARDRCDVFAEALGNTSEGAMLQLRSAAYLEQTVRPEAAEPVYRAFVQKLPNTPHARQAESLLWFHASPSNALLGANVNGAYKLYLDGALVGEGDSPYDMDVARVRAGPGPHEIAVEATPTRPEGWVSVFLRAHGTNVASDLTWEYTQQRPVNWPATDDPAAAWKPGSGSDFILPIMAGWAFVPNAFVGMQSGRQNVRIWNTWHNENPPRTAYIRKRFVVPDSR